MNGGASHLMRSAKPRCCGQNKYQVPGIHISISIYILPFIEKTTTETVIGLRHGGAGDGGEGI